MPPAVKGPVDGDGKRAAMPAAGSQDRRSRLAGGADDRPRMTQTNLLAGGRHEPNLAVVSAVRRAKRGDAAAWDELVERFAPLVWGIARAHRLSDADAADVSQAIWLKLVEHLPAVKNPAAIGAWLATATRRECLRVLRAQARVTLSGDALEVPDGRAAVDERLLLGERDALLWKAVSRLRASDQALLRLLAVEPALSYLEISAALAMPIGSIGPTRARALERLRVEVERLEAADALR